MLTPKDRRVYEIQYEFQEEHGFAPTIRQIAKLYGTPSWTHVLDSLDRLVAARLLSKADLTREGIYRPTTDPAGIDWESLIDGKEAG